ncbi:BTB/POZ domain-containing protein At5g60050 [Pistacia vera]|uniref:BTB/POZ domain-containing protein At5g60050 n=1 Tax=Pistacia vera TaxID=55513 RepID=UPI0012638509|nr:BTB/POZ domain-containing protein At5g60050 [Pistacia vera]XP_031282376.1 BTB/POZ domain-containing protein At5g60050 [Pistacia vera]
MSTREVSAMIKQGFISDQTLSFSPSRTTATPSRLYSPSSSPPPASTQQSHPQLTESIRHSHAQPTHHPTLFEMMSQEQIHETNKPIKSQSRIFKLLSDFRNPKGPGNGLSYVELGPGDVRLTVVGKDGFRVCMDVHKKILAEKSRFFAEKLARKDKENREILHTVEISECDDVEVYVETVVLMYCEDLKKRLLGEDLDRVLALLKVSAAVMFDTGIMSCLEHLEAVPWSEDDEEKVISVLSELDLQDSAAEVLQRLTSEPSTSTRADDIFLKLLSGVLQAKDDKARREMKTVISRLLKEDASGYDNVSKDTLYSLCHRCLSSLILCLSEATGIDDSRRDRGVLMAEIAREADNLHWIVDILIDKKICDEFVKVWADQKELAILHSKIPTMYRHEISRITAQLCIAIGRGLILVPKDTRSSLLSTWLEALYEDFGWMKRACRSVDRKLVEDGLSQTILTLPLLQQQAILLNWFDRFLNKGADCPNIQKAFEIWWRRAFIRQYSAEQDSSHLQITVCDYPK